MDISTKPQLSFLGIDFSENKLKEWATKGLQRISKLNQLKNLELYLNEFKNEYK